MEDAQSSWKKTAAVGAPAAAPSNSTVLCSLFVSAIFPVDTYVSSSHQIYWQLGFNSSLTYIALPPKRSGICYRAVFSISLHFSQCLLPPSPAQAPRFLTWPPHGPRAANRHPPLRARAAVAKGGARRCPSLREAAARWRRAAAEGRGVEGSAARQRRGLPRLRRPHRRPLRFLPTPPDAG